MFDMMTRPLQQVTQALNLTISSMDDLANSANSDIKIANTLNSAKGAIQRANTGLQELSNSQEHATNEQNKFNNSINNGVRSSDGLLGKVKGLVGGYLGLQAAKQGIKSTIGGAMGLQQQLFTLQGIMGNKDVATAYFDNLQKKGNESVFAFEDFAANARKYMQFTKNTDSLDKLANMSERLTLMDPTQGLQGAGFALKEAMSGDFVSLKERFGFGKADAEILKASKDMDDFINKFDTLLNKKGFTESMLKQYNQSAAAQFDNLRSNAKTALAQAGNQSLETIAPVITRINQAFNNGSFQTFFNGVSSGLNIIVTLALGVGDVFQWIGQSVQNNWQIIIPIVWGVIGAMIAYNATMGVAWLTTIKSVGAKIIHTAVSWAETAAIFAMILAQDGLNAALAACPITWIIIAVIALIAIFYAAVGAVNHFAGTSISATGIIMGVFATLGAFLYDLFLGVFELILGIINGLVNPFIRMGNFITNVFKNPVSSVIHLFESMADGILATLQKIASAMDFVFGSKMTSTVGDWRSGLKGMADAAVKEYAPNENYKNKMNEIDLSVESLGLKRINYSDAYKSGYNLGDKIEEKFDFNKIFNGLGKMPEMPKNEIPDMNSWNAAQGPGELSMLDPDSKKHLKNIDDKIDVSNEQLELMRDLAEQESIQNFVSLTPTVQVTTGDIKEEADVNKIIAKIESYMENEMANSAEGLYA